jgi:hypothetical protein
MRSISNSKSKFNEIFDKDLVMIDNEIQMTADSELENTSELQTVEG